MIWNKVVRYELGAKLFIAICPSLLLALITIPMVIGWYGVRHAFLAVTLGALLCIGVCLAASMLWIAGGALVLLFARGISVLARGLFHVTIAHRHRHA